MKTTEFIHETLSHYVRQADGPPPGVSSHIDSARFETELVAVCAYQHLAPIIMESLESLALPPDISRVTMERIRGQALEAERQTQRCKEALLRVVTALDQAGIRYMALGDAWAALRMANRHPVRSIDTLGLIVAAADLAVAEVVLNELGFAAQARRPAMAADRFAEEALCYHQYMAPLVMADSDGIRLHLRSRIIDFGPPELEEYAWSRAQRATMEDTEVQLVSDEDHLVYSAVEFGAHRYRRLLDLLDAGVILGGSEIDWGYVTGRLRIKGLYTAAYAALERVVAIVHLPRALDQLVVPVGLRRHTLALSWRAGMINYARPPEGYRRPLVYYMLGGDSFMGKARWSVERYFPKPSWVTSFYGRAAGLILPIMWLQFLRDTRNDARRLRATSGRGHTRDVLSRADH